MAEMLLRRAARQTLPGSTTKRLSLKNSARDLRESFAWVSLQLHRMSSATRRDAEPIPQTHASTLQCRARLQCVQPPQRCKPRSPDSAGEETRAPAARVRARAYYSLRAKQRGASLLLHSRFSRAVV